MITSLGAEKAPGTGLLRALVNRCWVLSDAWPQGWEDWAAS